MAPHWPQEVDVFSEPHSRMKKLVHKYSKMVSATDFSDEFHMMSLLQNLVNVFYEFKAHEHIENIHIMRNLKRKLKAACVTSAAVCNCHSDNRLTDMLEMVVHGLRSRWTEKSVKERQSYGHKLQKALEDFTQNFIPHMEEEEEIFQPMLMQYFSYEELKELKARVIHEHYVSTKTKQEKFVEDFNQSDESTNVKTKLSHFDLLPDEICEKVFSYLNPQDLGRAAQTCQRWNRLTKDPALWTGIYPVHWAAGNWTFHPEPLGGVDGAGEFDDKLMVEIDPVVCYDEDADIDESSSCGDAKDYCDDEDNSKDGHVLKEAKLMSALVKYLLPVVGSGVKVVDLAYSRGVNSSLVHKMLKLCPNVEVLDLTHTQVGDAAFYEYGVSNRQSKLRHLDLTNCHNITDQTLFSLVGITTILGKGWGVVDQEMTKDVVMNNQKEEEVEIENAVLCCHKEQTSCCKGKSRSNSVSSVTDDALDSGAKIASDGGCKKITKVELSFEERCDHTSGCKREDAVKKKCNDISDTVSHDNYESCDNINTLLESISLSDNLDIADRSHGHLETTLIVGPDKKFTTSDSLDKLCSCSKSQQSDLTVKNDAKLLIPSNSCCKSGNNCSFGRKDHLCSSEKKCQSSASSSSIISSSNFQWEPDCHSASSHPSSVSSPQSPTVVLTGHSPNINTKMCCDKLFSFNSTVVNRCCVSSDQLSLSAMPDGCCTADSDDKCRQKDIISLKPILPGMNATLPVRPLTHLEFLSLNGCYLISDQGLEALSYCGGTPSLGHLDLSGCLGLTGAGIECLVSSCGPEFDHAQLFYCDNIPSDPYPTTASGCRNLGCGTRFCCSAD